MVCSATLYSSQSTEICRHVLKTFKMRLKLFPYFEQQHHPNLFNLREVFPRRSRTLYDVRAGRRICTLVHFVNIRSGPHSTNFFRSSRFASCIQTAPCNLRTEVGTGQASYLLRHETKFVCGKVTVSTFARSGVQYRKVSEVRGQRGWPVWYNKVSELSVRP